MCSFAELSLGIAIACAAAAADDSFFFFLLTSACAGLHAALILFFCFGCFLLSDGTVCSMFISFMLLSVTMLLKVVCVSSSLFF